MKLVPEQFIGAWSLVDWRIEYGDGRVTHPFGENAAGQLVYSADGRMSATVSAAERPRFDQADARQASEAQKAEAFESYFHYAGTWRIEGDTVIHGVEFALNPDMVGTEQRRHVQFDGATKLRLSAGEDLDDGTTRHHILLWKRFNR